LDLIDATIARVTKHFVQLKAVKLVYSQLDPKLFDALTYLESENSVPLALEPVFHSALVSTRNHCGPPGLERSVGARCP
jgi:hypothetical protein